METVLITGGSQGIGFQLAWLFAADEYRVIICGRDMMRLQEARMSIIKDHPMAKIECVAADLSQIGSAEQLYRRLAKKNIKVLVNNAGCGYVGKAWRSDSEKEERMVVLNDASLMTLSKLFLKDFINNNEGTIVNIASTAAFQPGPYNASYYASKAFVYSYTRALAYEARPYDVHIAAVCPGPTDTDFYIKAGVRKPRRVMDPARVAEITYKQMRKKEVIIPGFLNKCARFVPLKIRVWYVAKTKQKLLRQQKERKKKGS